MRQERRKIKIFRFIYFYSVINSRLYIKNNNFPPRKNIAKNSNKFIIYGRLKINIMKYEIYRQRRKKEKK